MNVNLHIKKIALISVLGLMSGNPSLSAGNATLLGWNNLGMHCMDSDYSVFSILPPYNTIEAQLIVNGKLLVNGAGYTVTYQSIPDPQGSFNSTSIGKGNFYTFSPWLYGTVAPDMGLAGWGMPGPGNIPQGMEFENFNQPAAGVSTGVNWFRAEGIPLSPFDDQMHKNTYPMMRLVARDASNTVIATNDIVLPVSDEMDCRACHASGTQAAAKPLAGWVSDTNPERNYRLNILRLHDERQFSLHATEYATALAAKNFNPAGLFANVIKDGHPVLCATCHLSEALPNTGFGSIPPLTQAVHTTHATVTSPNSTLTLDNTSNRQACYMCHPGSSTKCLRGAMGSAIALDGTMEMQCQSCHGSMSQVGATTRVGWFMEPNCQSCHTGTATHNNGQIRYTSVFTDIHGTVRQPVDQTFATTPNTPATGLSLYRFSRGHGGLQCSACHGSTHAEFPSSHANDNVSSIQLQGHAGVMVECTSCHTSMPNTVNGGPHGMHPMDASWVVNHHDRIGSVGVASCKVCHGTDYRGTVLSRAQGDRSYSVFGGQQFFKGATIGCYTCHMGPNEGDANPTPAPTVGNTSVSTANGQPVLINLPASGSNATVRIISQPANGTVGLNIRMATYYPTPGFVGKDTFTYAAYDGSKNSHLGTCTVTVGPVSLPQITTQPTSQTVTVGASVNLGVAATGTAPLNYQWRVNGTTIAGATTATLALSNVTAANAGVYSVVVSNAAGSVTSANATLTIKPVAIAINLTSPVNNAVYPRNTSVIIKASVTPVANVIKVQFYDGSTLLGTVTSAPYTIKVSTLRPGVHSLTAKAIDTRKVTTASTAVSILVK